MSTWGRGRLHFAGAAACALSFGLPMAHAQDFPPKQMTLVVGFPAGGGTDLFARLFAQKIGVALGSTVVVDNRPGAAGTVGTATVVRAAPTGQTLLFTPSSIALTAATYRKLPFDPQADLAPIVLTSRIPFVLVVHPALPAHNVKEFLTIVKTRPGALDYGSSGAGSPPHFAMELLKSRTGVNITHIPYKGAAQINTALLSGEVQASFLVPPIARPHIQTGKMRGLAVTTRARSATLPGLPSLHEAGVPGFEITQWHAIFAPSRTPSTIVARVNAVVVKALAGQDVRERLASEGAEPVGSSPEELAVLLASEIRSYSGLAQRLELKLE